MEHTRSTEQEKTQPRQRDEGVEECIENCLECFQVCTRLVPHCLQMGGPHAEAEHIGLLINCATLCETAAKFMMTESEFHREVCRVCAKVCLACADDCEKIAEDDAMMKECVQRCRDCAESCEKMASH